MELNKIVVSGMRPTNKLHLGNLIGALNNFVSLQNDNKCFYFIADWHAFMSEYENFNDLRNYMIDMGIDWLSSGLNPEKSTLFIQSYVPEHSELFLLFSIITPLGWLERVPTYKEQMRELEKRAVQNYGFLGYPVLQAADILLYKGNLVPVGQDQLHHVELTREIARKFNLTFNTDLFPEAKELLTQFPKMPGIDGRKMSKSYGNAIFLSDTFEEIWEKVRKTLTDPQRIRRKDPGDPNICPVFSLHKIFSNDTQKEAIIEGCTTGNIGCVDCKKIIFNNIKEYLGEFKEKRNNFEKDRDYIWDILMEGSSKARKVAKKNYWRSKRCYKTLNHVRSRHFKSSA